MNDETTFEFLERGGRTEAIGIRQWIENTHTAGHILSHPFEAMAAMAGLI